MPRFDTSELADRIGGTLEGEGSLSIDGVAAIEKSRSGQVTFVTDERHSKLWADSMASCVIVSRELKLPPRSGSVAVIRVENAEESMVRILELFEPAPRLPEIGIHPSAVIQENVTLGEDVRIGPFCHVENGCAIGDHAVLFSNVHLHSGVSIGAESTLYAGVVIRNDCSIGSRTTLHANAVIGTDGFGFQPASDGSGLVKIPHIGTVEIGDEVEIGSCTCIDRGKFAATKVGDGTKIDNLCQIGHNCEIGRNCVLCGHVGIAGSTHIGDGTQIGGGAGISDHLKIGRGVSIGGFSGVMSDIPDGETWVGAPAGNRSRILREHAAIRKLPEWSKLLRRFISQEKASKASEE